MNRMAAKAIILSEIDIDEEYNKLDPAVINDISPDNYLGCKAGFAGSAKILGISAEIELEITYRDFAKLVSRMGYKKKLFQESPAIYNDDPSFDPFSTLSR